MRECLLLIAGHLQLESVFLRDKDYLCGREISIADLACVCELMQPYAAGKH